jgi:hypothetical protein
MFGLPYDFSSAVVAGHVYPEFPPRSLHLVLTADGYLVGGFNDLNIKEKSFMGNSKRSFKKNSKSADSKWQLKTRNDYVTPK